jgi:nitrite reductase/ring-hydroxylating ferredoxin subunit
MTARLAVARLEDVPTGAARVFEAAGFRVLLTRVGDALHALQGSCPHRGCAWDGAAVEDGIVRCPVCRFRYSARTGLNPLTTACHVNQSTAEYHYRNFPEGRAETYEAWIDEGRVLVDTTPRPFVKILC